MGMENGSPLDKIEDVAYFHQRGIRYVTLTHGKDNHISDSSYDTLHTHHGLIDFVGLGSDFDGVGLALPPDLDDADEYPNLIAELLRRSYSDEDVQKICSGNVLRVWRANE